MRRRMGVKTESGDGAGFRWGGGGAPIRRRRVDATQTAGYLSRASPPRAAGTRVGRGRGRAPSGASSWSSGATAGPQSRRLVRRLAEMSGEVRDRAGVTLRAGGVTPGWGWGVKRLSWFESVWCGGITSVCLSRAPCSPSRRFRFHGSPVCNYSEAVPFHTNFTAQTAGCRDLTRRRERLDAGICF